MNNFDLMRQQTLDRQQELLTEAAWRRLLSTDRPERGSSHAPVRGVVADWLRHVADRLEPVADRPQVRSAIR